MRAAGHERRDAPHAAGQRGPARPAARHALRPPALHRGAGRVRKAEPPLLRDAVDRGGRRRREGGADDAAEQGRQAAAARADRRDGHARRPDGDVPVVEARPRLPHRPRAAHQAAPLLDRVVRRDARRHAAAVHREGRLDDAGRQVPGGALHQVPAEPWSDARLGGGAHERRRHQRARHARVPVGDGRAGDGHRAAARDGRGPGGGAHRRPEDRPDGAVLRRALRGERLHVRRRVQGVPRGRRRRADGAEQRLLARPGAQDLRAEPDRRASGDDLRVPVEEARVLLPVRAGGQRADRRAQGDWQRVRQRRRALARRGRQHDPTDADRGAVQR